MLLTAGAGFAFLISPAINLSGSLKESHSLVCACSEVRPAAASPLCSSPLSSSLGLELIKIFQGLLKENHQPSLFIMKKRSVLFIKSKCFIKIFILSPNPLRCKHLPNVSWHILFTSTCVCKNVFIKMFHHKFMREEKKPTKEKRKEEMSLFLTFQHENSFELLCEINCRSFNQLNQVEEGRGTMEGHQKMAARQLSSWIRLWLWLSDDDWLSAYGYG